MGVAIEKLTAMVDADNRFDIPWTDIRRTQIEAANERFQDRIGSIGLLRHRAEAASIGEIRSEGDLVPLLFAHTAFKSYPESWLIEGKWKRLGKWLDTVSTEKVGNIDTAGIADLDEWLERLKEKGHFVSCSSGTTGKCSMIVASTADRPFIRRYAAAAFQWATGISPNKDYRMMGTTPVTVSPRAEDSRLAISDNFGDGDDFRFPGKPITIGGISRMVALRRSIADGTARPADIAAFEAVSAERAKTMAGGVDVVAEAMIAARGKKLMIGGMFAGLYPVAQKVREMGYGGEDFHPENALQVGGGLKGAALPPDYRAFILETFNIQPERIYQYYSMQELSSPMPRCRADRYHVPPWLILLLLDEGGDTLIHPREGDMEGRAGFFDIGVEGRWGGLITGDKVSVNYARCACGHQGPTVGADIVRYADMIGGDKISCSGTIDAYVRGVS